MTPAPENSQENLARAVTALARGLPPRRAPRTLEARVLAAVALQAALAALPWWRKSYAHWPLAARCAFLVGSAAFAKLALMGAVWVGGGFDAANLTSAFATPVAWLDLARNLAAGAGTFASTLFRAIPPLWLYGGLALVASCYAALFGLGAAAYRTLHAAR